MFPILTWLHIHVESDDEQGEDVLLMIPNVVQTLSVLHDVEPIRSILIGDTERQGTEILTWTTHGGDVDINGPAILDNTSRSACFMFAAQGYNKRDSQVPTAIFDTFLNLLPLASVSSLTAQNHTHLSKEFWLRHASMLPLEQARLVSDSAREFWKMLVEEPRDSDGPQLPMLTTLILHEVRMDRKTWRHLRDILIERVEQGVPLECLELSDSAAARYAINKFSEIVVDVRESTSEDSRDSFLDNLKWDEFDDGRGVLYIYYDTDSGTSLDSRGDFDDRYDGSDLDLDSEDGDDRGNREFEMGLLMRIH